MIKIIKSFAFAIDGVKICFTSETNFKIHTITAVLVIILGFALRISNTEWLIIIGCIAFVITMEMLNTAMEKLCDVVQQSFHPGIKKVKDIAAASVLVSAIGSAIIGTVIFLPKIIFYIKSL